MPLLPHNLGFREISEIVSPSSHEERTGMSNLQF